MTNLHNDTGVQPMEIDRDGNMQNIDRLIVAHGTPGQAIQFLLLVPQAIRQTPLIQRLIPDEPCKPGLLWLGECAVCLNSDNEGFLCSDENGMTTCGHPLCGRCATCILGTTKACPKCRRLVHSFLPVRIP